MSEYILELKDVVKTFGGVKALNGVHFQLKRGEIHALMGENGAGKSTFIKVITGVHQPDSGIMLLDGEQVTLRNTTDSAKLGIAAIYQHVTAFPDLTVTENIFMGREIKNKFGFYDWKTMRQRAKELIQPLSAEIDVNKPMGNLSVAEQQLVEIAKALAKNAKLLILDEPTASLNEDDSKALLDLLLKFKKQGMTSIIISHKLNEISYVADKITVIRDGSTIETLDKKKDDFSEQRIIQGMVGREMTDRFPKRPNVKIGDVSMEIKNWNVYHPLYTERKVVNNVSFKVHKGEVVGISGLMGAGRTELAMSIFGKSYGTKISGQVFMNGKEVKLNTVQEAIDNKLAYVTEDRKGNGLILSKSIKMNTTLANMSGISNGKVIDTDKEYAVAEEYRKKLKTKCPTVEQNVGNLSGGNQQKVLLAKWMFAEPDILILDEPTRGIDVGAKYEIYCIINDLVAAGKSVIMISSELPEVLGMSDRIYIMNEGRFVGEVSGEEATSELIMSRIVKSGKGE